MASHPVPSTHGQACHKRCEEKKSEKEEQQHCPWPSGERFFLGSHHKREKGEATQDEREPYEPEGQGEMGGS